MIDALVTFAIRVAGAALAFAMQALLARLMTPDSYGAYVLIWTWLIAVGGVAALGLAESGVRFIPRYQARSRAGDIAGFWRFGFSVVIGASVILCLGGLVLARLLPEDGYVASIAFFVAIGLPFFAMDRYLEGVARGLGWYRLTSVPVYVVRPVLIVGACAAVASATGELALEAAGWILTVSMAAVTVGVAIVMARRLRQEHTARNGALRRRSLWMRASLPLLLVAGFEDLLTYSDLLIIGFMLPHESAALYFAAARCMALANFAYYAIFFVAARRFSLAAVEEGGGDSQRVLGVTTMLTIATTVVAVAATLVAGPLLLAVFGEAFAAGYGVMAILGLGLVARSLAGQAHEFLIVSGGHRQALAINAGAVAFNAAISILLIRALGVEGAAIGTALTMALRAAALAVVVRRDFGLRLFALS